MAITEIRRVRNDSNESIVVRNLESSGDWNNPIVPPKTSKGCGIWIPWCWHPDQRKDHHINVSIGSSYYSETKLLYSIWQHGEYVRFSKDGFWHYPSDYVPGEAGVSGRRILAINEDQSIKLEIFWENP